MLVGGWAMLKIGEKETRQGGTSGERSGVSAHR